MMNGITPKLVITFFSTIIIQNSTMIMRILMMLIQSMILYQQLGPIESPTNHKNLVATQPSRKLNKHMYIVYSILRVHHKNAYFWLAYI